MICAPIFCWSSANASVWFAHLAYRFPACSYCSANSRTCSSKRSTCADSRVCSCAYCAASLLYSCVNRFSNSVIGLLQPRPYRGDLLLQPLHLPTVSALARLRRQDLEDQGAQRVLRFREKGGQQREIPVRHDLDRWLEAYLQAARIAADPKETPLFRAALGKQKKLSRNPLSANSMRRMLKRRLKDARLPDIFSPHSFRVLVVTDLLTQDVPLEDVQYLAGHANPKTTQIYDRRQKRVTRNIVERISV